jgi:hypothetical protein
MGTEKESNISVSIPHPAEFVLKFSKFYIQNNAKFVMQITGLGNMCIVV